MGYIISRSPEELAGKCAENIAVVVGKASAEKRMTSIALSGGNTPRFLFETLESKYGNTIPWSFVHFFWVDERCVPPDDSESNYGNFRRILLDKISMPSANVHRMKGEEDPCSEAARYADEIMGSVQTKNGLPVFDLILLGLGDDGHTASIFPGKPEIIRSDRICETAVHPLTGQTRITLTIKVLNNAKEIWFLVTGSNKATVIRDIFNKEAKMMNYPASFIVPYYGRLSWFLDKDASELLTV